MLLTAHGIVSIVHVHCETRLLHTEGGELFWLAGGRGCNEGDTAREDFDCTLEAWYMGSEGVAALDMLAWPEDLSVGLRG
jgi:hypothetical protein